MQKSTKIVATLGPASDDPHLLEQLLNAGVNTVRLNFSHGTAADHLARAARVRELAERIGVAVAILADLQGPKIRIGKFEEQKVTLQGGERFILDANCKSGNATRVGLDYTDLPNDVRRGDRLLLDDGKIQLVVDDVAGGEIHTTVLVGGELSNNKGINRMGGGLSAPALTAKDMEDIKTCAALGADFVAVSFPKSDADIHMARTLLRAAGSHAAVIAKIERCEAVDNLDNILAASDGIMVARGDLAVEVGDAAVPALQKRMIRAARRHHKLVITATQMMESMISSPVPTRAEVSDCANAVLDGTDAVMLSAESASGRYPLESVQALARTCVEAERMQDDVLEHEFAGTGRLALPEQTMAMSAVYAARHLELKAIITLAPDRASLLCLSRFTARVPVYAVTSCLQTYRHLALHRNVFPVLLPATKACDALTEAKLQLQHRGRLSGGDMVAVLQCSPGSSRADSLQLLRCA
ncbi:pyruvate kinase [Jeongeupia wiesaeckerbachi]|uniref:pyruvate kinase n=1 Tax=Jeongeupia wiesaeckerbachi TaxID=3051218 RepID=UPI003D80494C